MIEFVPINLWGIGTAVLAAWVVAGLWYSPLLFIRPWAEMSGVDGAKFAAGLRRAIAVDLASFAVMAFILDQVLHAWGALTIVSTVLCTFLLWLGFVAVTLLHSVTMSTGLCTIMRSMPAIAWSAWWQWV
ncbi:MAG: DUF1761 domain-containing protein [Mesorhizobium sp.]|uniref:DUF1761 domain-containing protein n=1 Tax=Mesorhizobium sp. TaxID=1871066 RepID=UPI0012043085|nr:DUF1761 domain-containing protein [Mesorhizobium sp.]TIL76048.1 MAG: DUF1761 domain-containing protein [Mesorhizobium sp.]TIL87337.1 MAG: DUF1761 domain-containing protein [Mesorhizobium sp.]TIL97526.1 MAG: DUF1761 domain-containing protein [Mesorhizobium sp.]